MAFMRKEAVVEATDLTALSPEEAERKIIAGVKKYANNEANYSAADANTPYLGHVVGMGIESSNQVDITMSIERQFLTRMTKRVPLAEGSAEFRLEQGELGQLRILDDQDALAATPGLCIKLLMDHGHMPRNQAYLEKVVSFTYVTALADAYKLNDALKKALAKLAGLAGPARADALANLKALAAQARAVDAQLADPAKLAEVLDAACRIDRASREALTTELRLAREKLKVFTTSGDTAKVAEFTAEEAVIKTRLKMSEAKLAISREVAVAAARRSPLEEAKVGELRAVLGQTLSQAALAS